MSLILQQRRCRNYGDDYGDVMRIDDDRDVLSLTTHDDESNRVISTSLKAHSLEVYIAYSCVINKAAQSVKRKFIREATKQCFLEGFHFSGKHFGITLRS